MQTFCIFEYGMMRFYALFAVFDEFQLIFVEIELLLGEERLVELFERPVWR